MVELSGTFEYNEVKLSAEREKVMNNIEEMKDMIQSFCEERNWNQFHNPKDLAIGISTEANELLDIFRFKSVDEISQNYGKYKIPIEDEIADILFFVLRFAQMNDIDLGEALRSKLEKNAQKYPVELAYGNNKKYNEYV